MYVLYDDVTDKDFIWIQCDDSLEKRKVVNEFISKGFNSNLTENDYEGLPHLIVDYKNNIILHCSPSMAVTLRNNGIKPYKGYEFIKIIIS